MKEIYKCTFTGCSKVYVNSAILKRHVQAFHSTVNKFQCKVCNKSLASRQNLKEHSYIHTGEKPYVCKEPGCKMGFRQGTHLSAHKKLHQKGEWSISYSVLTKLVVSFRQGLEEFGTSCEVDLPGLARPESIPILPSLF